MLVMHNMELDDEDKIDAVLPMPMPMPDYPCGLRICLTEKEMGKLGLDPSVAVADGMVHGHFMARILPGSNVGVDGTCRIELQIEDLAIESEDEENK